MACPSCHGKGFTRCLACQGEGWGLGSESRERCIVCGSGSYGHGRQDCNRCGAKGRVACPVCDSYGQLKCFIQLTVSWYELSLAFILMFIRCQFSRTWPFIYHYLFSKN